MNSKTLQRQRNRYSASYPSNREIIQMIGERLFERLDLVTITPERILDIGCADGYFTDQLEKRYKKAQVLGIDISNKMCQQAQDNTRWLSKKRYLSCRHDQLPLPDSSVDLIFSNLYSVWFEDLHRFFEEMNRVLTDTGLIIFTNLGPDSLKEITAAWHKADPDYPHTENFADMHDVGDALTQNGFHGIVMESESLTINYDSLSELHIDLKQSAQSSLNPKRRKTLVGKSRYQQYQSEVAQLLTQDGLGCSLEIVYGHGWAGYKKPKMDIHDYRPTGIEIPTKIIE